MSDKPEELDPVRFGRFLRVNADFLVFIPEAAVPDIEGEAERPQAQ
jgi:hypothetical protein